MSCKKRIDVMLATALLACGMGMAGAAEPVMRSSVYSERPVIFPAASSRGSRNPINGGGSLIEGLRR